MAYDIAFLIGRIIVGLYFIFSGFNHFKDLGVMTGYAKSKGVPAPAFMVVITGIMLLLGGLSIGFGVYPYIGVLLLGVFLLITTFAMHDFWNTPSDQKQSEKINFLKNWALIGSLLMFLAIQTPWVLSL